jgi:hypothetical protein
MHPTESMVTLRLRLGRANAEKVKHFVAAIASEPGSEIPLILFEKASRIS